MIRRGFTIVELLIVIVVLAILATISFLSYRGLAERAKNSNIEAAADAYVKVMQLYKSEHGGYPAAHHLVNNTAHVQGWWGVCLGILSDYPESNMFSEGQCGNGGNGLNMSHQGDIMYSEALSEVLQEHVAKVPSTRHAKVDPIFRGFLYITWQRGGVQNSNQVATGSNRARIQFFAHVPNYQCPKGWTAAANFGGNYQTRCEIVLP